MIHILSNQETKEILSKLNEQFGIQKILGRLIKIGKERIFLFNGDFSDEQIKNLEKIVFIEKIGIYVGAIFLPTDEIRLSIEGTQIFKDQITKNLFEINEEKFGNWMQGEELNIQTGLKGIIVIKYRNNFLGCGKASENKIGNFIPKSRRLRSKNIIK
ncbi:MAG TPA: hypothetical protein VJA20_04490 [Candidatus Nanoarchaeia archaeon]|nr:hypothetical protein [Candidatus Nanoarchaeia archaeon]